jgi:hypothetical protein
VLNEVPSVLQFGTGVNAQSLRDDLQREFDPASNLPPIATLFDTGSRYRER